MYVLQYTKNSNKFTVDSTNSYIMGMDLIMNDTSVKWSKLKWNKQLYSYGMYAVNMPQSNFDIS